VKSQEQHLELANDEDCSTDHCCGTCDVCDAGILNVNDLVDKKIWKMTGNCDKKIWNVTDGSFLNGYQTGHVNGHENDLTNGHEIEHANGHYELAIQKFTNK
jgi:hypothetical protein